MRLDNYLLRELRNVPKSHVYRIIRSGEVRINRGRAKPASRLSAGDEVRIPPVRRAEKRGSARPPDDLLRRVSEAAIDEGDDWLLLNKATGLAAHAGTGVRFGVIEALRAARGDTRLELVHRLDRETSGCLLIAKNRAALNRMQAAWRDRAVEKEYLALLGGVWQGGKRAVDAPLLRDQVQGGERMVQVSAAGKSAHSCFRPLECFAAASLQAVTIKTGRTHQIRVHAAHIGHPVAGDRKYGTRSGNQQWRAIGLERMFLHAWRLRLPGSHKAWQAELPPDLANLLEQLRSSRDATI